MHAITLYVPIKDKHMTVHVYGFFIDNIFFILNRSRTSILLKDCIQISFFCHCKSNYFGDVINMIHDSFLSKNGSVIT